MSTKIAAGPSASKSASRSRVKTVEITKKATSNGLKNKAEDTEKKKKSVAKAIPRDGRVKQPPKNQPGAALTPKPRTTKNVAPSTSQAPKKKNEIAKKFRKKYRQIQVWTDAQKSTFEFGG